MVIMGGISKPLDNVGLLILLNLLFFATSIYLYLAANVLLILFAWLPILGIFRALRSRKANTISSGN